MLTVQACNLNNVQKIKTGIGELDCLFGGGLHTNGIIEICGESGSGKTQLCLQLCLTAQLKQSDGGSGGCVIYISTQDVFPSKRLQQLIQAQDVSSNYDFGSNIFVEHIPDYASIKKCLTQKVPKLLLEKKVKVLIVDSVAALFRATYGSSDGNARTQDMRELGAILLGMNFEHRICVICVNQVTACFSSEGSVAALGLAWANIVNTRIQLFRGHGPMRIMKVLFSPSLPKYEINFEISERGLKDCTKR